ncbi:DUF459 domain-containing protein [Desulfovibrio sp. TomC]|uniref:DUF459 domain-containing protein n=1 Tax=Desulfovibrio sp. TomC TaxID=1562888 RepID=UPI0005750C3D|nr:DUF459 domain-containing protein [Desulfovibrio sp. TomC]KHK00970.1 hypothetical protein NY78_3640 [Desulfovibrio sp. TomC]
MHPYARIASVLVLLLLTLPGCAKQTATAPGGTAASPDAAAAVPPEAEVKPAPINGLPAAVPPVVATTPEPAASPIVPVVPEQATKQALDPKLARTAAMTPPRSEPVAPSLETPRPEPTPTKSRPKTAVPSPETHEAPAAAGKNASESAPFSKDQTGKGKAKIEGPAVAVVGDSLAVGVGMTMEARLKKAGSAGCRPMGKVSTGLISKKKYDWDKELAELLAREPISAVVVVLGGNDANNAIAGKAAGTPEWNAGYAEKAERFVRIAANAQAKVLWVGLPAMKEAAYSKRVEAVNAAAKTACFKVAGCTYMEASDIFTDEAGHYVQAKAVDGKTVSLRAGDGVHMTMTGYDLLCRRVLDKLDLTGGRPRQ